MYVYVLKLVTNLLLRPLSVIDLNWLNFNVMCRLNTFAVTHDYNFNILKKSKFIQLFYMYLRNMTFGSWND